jgi:hypothetical protein
MSRENLIKTRKGRAIDWATFNPTLAEGEPGFETDTLKFKVGDGLTAWNNLAYLRFDGGNLDENTITGDSFQSIAGVITLTNFFDTTEPMQSYIGATGSTVIVPAGYDYAIFIDSQGNITEEVVYQGQILVFKSQIVAGKNKVKWATCVGKGEYRWDGYWQPLGDNCKCTGNCTPSVIPEYDCTSDNPSSYDDKGRPTRMPLEPLRPGYEPQYPTPVDRPGKFPGEIVQTPCFCKTCLLPPSSQLLKKSDNTNLFY